ncbi:9097_t:CDS:2, partial [Acaulospora colombiana]
DTKELHEEITALKLRINQLEQALAELQAQLTPEPHPLLAQSLKAVTESLQSDHGTSKITISEEEELIDTFGSLTIDPKGETICSTSIRWEDFRQMILEPVYSPQNIANDQQIAILFISLALAILADPDRPMYHPDAQRYYHLSKASISLGEVGEVWYRDNEQWDKYPEEADRRRRIWWELLETETSQGFVMGRPRSIYPASVIFTSITNRQYDTRMPKDDEDEGKPPSCETLSLCGQTSSLWQDPSVCFSEPFLLSFNLRKKVWIKNAATGMWAFLPSEIYQQPITT